MIINSDTHPHVIDAMDCLMMEAAGAQSIDLPIRDIPDRWRPYVDNVETTIARLSKTERAPESEQLPSHVKPDAFLDSEFYAFVNGEYHEQNAISNRDINYTEAALFLSDFFEDWQLTGDDPKTEPGNIARQKRIEWLREVEQESAAGLSEDQRAELDKLLLELV